MAIFIVRSSRRERVIINIRIDWIHDLKYEFEISKISYSGLNSPSDSENKKSISLEKQRFFIHDFRESIKPFRFEFYSIQWIILVHCFRWKFPSGEWNNMGKFFEIFFCEIRNEGLTRWFYRLNGVKWWQTFCKFIDLTIM